MKCEDCLHDKVCAVSFGAGGTQAEYIGCTNFKDKNLFVELPCKVGDVVYSVIGQRADTKTRYIRKSTITERNALYYKRLFEEKLIFLTRSEADQKLEELRRE